jgi:hypothetical protein
MQYGLNFCHQQSRQGMAFFEDQFLARFQR